MAEQGIKEGKNAVEWTELPRFSLPNVPHRIESL
jgi:hypothetical protein